MGTGWLGVRTLFFGALAVVGGGVGIYFGFFFKGGSPYSLQETLPQMVSDFGAHARVVELQDSTDDIVFRVIGSDGLLHERDYQLQFSETSDGGTGKTRHVSNSESRPSTSDRRHAKVTLGQIPSGIVDKLLSAVGFPKDGSSATLTGSTWMLESGARPFDKYEARYDGSRLHQTQSKASVFGPGSSTGSGTSTGSTPSATAPPNAAPPSSGLHGKVGKLLACIQRAHQNVNKIIACQQRFGP
jgi:hypothetical protein